MAIQMFPYGRVHSDMLLSFLCSPEGDPFGGVPKIMVPPPQVEGSLPSTC